MFFWENDPLFFFGKIKFIKVMTATREAELIIISTYNHALCVCVCVCVHYTILMGSTCR